MEKIFFLGHYFLQNTLTSQACFTELLPDPAFIFFVLLAGMEAEIRWFPFNSRLFLKMDLQNKFYGV